MRSYFSEWIEAIKKGDLWTKCSLVILGAGYFARHQIAKGILLTLIEIGFFLFNFGFSMPYILKLNTLGTVERAEIFDPVTLAKTVNDYDNSLLILLFGVIGILFIFAFLLLYIGNMKAVYRLQVLAEEKKHINSLKEDLRELINSKFHVTLLTLPSLGVLLANVIPILFMVCIAFTNYDKDHQPPSYLFTWVGLENFKALVSTNATITFSYVFTRVLGWTLLWAVLATVTTFFGGVWLAKMINQKHILGKKFWRTCFVITIAIPQFVTLLLIAKMFGDYGIVNTLCNKIGLTDFLQKIGLVGKGLSYIPFLSKPGWAHVMIVLINIWIGVPYQMLSATGILLNIPEEQLESAKIDGANDRQIFHKITMPHILFILGPSLVTTVISNINNFNVIYLLTSDYVTGNMNYANSNAKEVDLLITWLFTLTNDYYNYKMASVIGICVFLISATITLFSFSKLLSGNREEDFQ